MKKTLVTLAAFAMSFAMVTPAFATDRILTADRGGTNTVVRNRTSVTSVATSQTAAVTNSVSTDCNSGANTVSSLFGDVKGAKITSGNSTCGSTVNNTVNKGTVTVNAPTTVGSEASGPTMDYFADRGGDNTDAVTEADTAAVSNTSSSSVANTQASTSNTGANSASTLFGDNIDAQITSGVAGNLNSLTQDLNTLMLSVIR